MLRSLGVRSLSCYTKHTECHDQLNVQMELLNLMLLCLLFLICKMGHYFTYLLEHCESLD